jgi:CHAT domain-containing protein
MNNTKILILTANPSNTDRLNLDQEIREIKAELERSELREQFEIITEGAVRVDDLSHAILKHNPTIVHFSGHGAGENGSGSTSVCVL